MNANLNNYVLNYCTKKINERMNEQDLSSILDTVIFLLRLWTLGGLDSPALKWASSGPMLALAWQEATLSHASCHPVSWLSLLLLLPLKLTCLLSIPSRSRKVTKASLTYLFLLKY